MPLTRKKRIKKRCNLLRRGVKRLNPVFLSSDRILLNIHQYIIGNKFENEELDIRQSRLDYFFSSNPQLVNDAIKLSPRSSDDSFYRLFKDWVDFFIETDGKEEIRVDSICILPSDEEIQKSYLYIMSEITDINQQKKVLKALYNHCILANRNTKLLWSIIKVNEPRVLTRINKSIEENIPEPITRENSSQQLTENTLLVTVEAEENIDEPLQNRQTTALAEISTHAQNSGISTESDSRIAMPIASEVQAEPIQVACVGDGNVCDLIERYEKAPFLTLSVEAVEQVCNESRLIELRDTLSKYTSYYCKVAPTGMQEVIHMIDTNQPTIDILIKLRDVAKNRAKPNFFGTRSAQTIEAYKAINEFFTKNPGNDNPKILTDLIETLKAKTISQESRP